jgi:GntR family transcriptional repressor for pyruvate dehydrogenase complex
MSIEAIYTRLSDQIARGEYLRGSRLPTEGELGKHFAASRSTVRKALARLKAEGVVQARQGSGSYVAARPGTSVDAPGGINSFADIGRLFEFRLLLEAEAARLAACNRTDDDLRAIEERGAALHEAIQRGSMGAREDFDLHVQIARASGNKFLLSATLQLQTHVLFGLALGGEVAVLPAEVRMQLVEAEHAAVIGPIVAGDAGAAEAAMRRHIELSFRRICDRVI